MVDDDPSCLPVPCPSCHAKNHIPITHPAHHALPCGSCQVPFVVDQALIEQFYNSDDSAHCVLEEFYRAPLVAYFQSRDFPLVKAEECQMEVFERVWKTKYPRPGNAPGRYDARHASGASFRTWLFQIARRVLADRKSRRDLFQDADSGRSRSSDDPSGLGGIQRDLRFDADPRPEDEASAREHRMAVRDCQERLSARQRLAVTVWLEEEGAWGVQKVLIAELRIQFPDQGASAATASNLINQALAAMRECLEGKGVSLN